MRSKRVSLKTIAVRAGVTPATVSYALHNHPGIPPATRDRVKSIAQQLGYRPDPLLGQLMAYLRTGMDKDMPYRATLAYLTDFSERVAPHRMYTYDQFFRGAEKRAHELGYQIEEFWLREPGMTGERMSRILKARGVPGVIVSPAPEQQDYPRIDWKRFSSVVVGLAKWNPLLHRCCNNQPHSLSLALRTLRSFGYQRIGCAFSASVDAMLDHNWLSAYLVDQYTIPAKDRVPLLLAENWSLQTFSEWYQAVRPQAVIGFQAPVLQWLQKMGVRVPEETGFATVDRFPADPPLTAAGVEQNSNQVGAAAVDLVTSQIAYNDQGVPATPKLLLLEGHWEPGPTVRVPGPPAATRRNRKAARATCGQCKIASHR